MKSFKILSLLVMFTLVISLFGCSKSKEDQFDAIKERGYIIVGLDDTFAPMGFREDGKIVGFDVDLAKAVGEELGLEVRFQPINWSMKEQELKNGNIDFIWNGYTITDERKEKVTFSDPYLENRQVIVVMASSNINSKADLAGKEVGLQKESSSLDAVNKEMAIKNSFKNGVPTEYDTNDFALRDLEIGRIDAVVVDEILARYYITIKGAENYRILSENFGTEEYGVGMRKTDVKLIEAFNEAFNNVKTNGVGETISKKWFNENILK